MEAIMSSNTHILSMERQAAQGIAQRLWRWWEAYWMRRAKRTTVALLRGLDDRMLHDIGIDRSEIESVVYSECSGRLLRCRSL
jgi:uncharacterized protein YjiS (DUF1127 family)